MEEINGEVINLGLDSYEDYLERDRARHPKYYKLVADEKWGGSRMKKLIIPILDEKNDLTS